MSESGEFEFSFAYESHDFNDALNEIALSRHGRLASRETIIKRLQCRILEKLPTKDRCPVPVSGPKSDREDRPKFVAQVQDAVQAVLGDQYRVVDDFRAIDCAGGERWRSSLSLALMVQTSIPSQYHQCYLDIACGLDEEKPPQASIPIRVKVEWWCG